MDSFQRARGALRKIEQARQAETAARRELAAALGELGLHLPGQGALAEQVLQGGIASLGAPGDHSASLDPRATSLNDLDLPSALEHPVAGEGTTDYDAWEGLLPETDLEEQDDVPFTQG